MRIKETRRGEYEGVKCVKNKEGRKTEKGKEHNKKKCSRKK
jgi:hypothetical protein